MTRIKGTRRATEIIEDVQNRQIKDPIRVTFYLSKSVYKKFQELCGDVSSSAVIHEWMKEAVKGK